MKLFTIACCFGVVAVANAQQIETVELDKPPKTVYLKLSPFSLISGTIPLHAGEMRAVTEVLISEKASYNFGASLIYRTVFKNAFVFPLVTGGGGADDTFWGYRFQGEFRYYWLKFTNQKRLSKALIPSGLYVSAHGSYCNATLKDRTIRFPNYNFTQVEANCLGGMQVMISDAVGIDIYTGLGYRNYGIFSVNGSNRTEVEPIDVGYLPTYGWPINFKFGTALVFGLF